MGKNKRTPADIAGRKRNRQRRKVRAKIKRSLWMLDHGPCQQCGSRDHLEIDHIIPLKKPHENIDIFMRSPEKQDAELALCQVLCRPCHLKKCITETLNTTHGRDRMYSKHGCRCQPCRDAHAAKRRQNRRNQRSRGIPWSMIN